MEIQQKIMKMGPILGLFQENGQNMYEKDQKSILRKI